MKNTIYTLFALLLLLTACRDEQITTEPPIVTTDPPQEVEGAFFSGQVTNVNGEAISGLIEIYQSGELAGSVISGADGSYNTLEIPLEVGSEVTFAIEEEAFVNNYRRIRSTSEPQIQNFRLIDSNINVNGSNVEYEDPGSDDLVKVYGTITDYSGVAIPDLYVTIAHDIIHNGGISWSFPGNYEITDETGYFEALAPKDTELYFFSFVHSELETECYPQINQIDTSVFGPLAFDKLGKLTEDTEVIENPDIRLSETNYELIGRFLDCDGNPVASGKVEVKVSFLNFFDTWEWSSFETTTFGPNGEFSIEFDYCHRGEVKVELLAESAEGFGIEDEYLTTTSDLAGDLGDLLACNNLNWFTSYMNLHIGDDYSFENIEFQNAAMEVPFRYFVTWSSHPDLDPMFFVTDELHLGQINVGISLDYLDQEPMNPYTFSSEQGQLIADVTEIANGVIRATFSGEVETNELGMQLVTGDFTINYE